MADKRVYIGVGHGGADPGAVANGFKESDVNLDVAKACYDYLKKNGVAVKISRTSDVNKDLNAYIAEANAFKADLALDIHHNAGGGDGAEVYHTIYAGTGLTLANNILAEMEKIGQNSRGAKIKKNEYGSDYFGFVRLTDMPAVLVECAFLDNKTDVKIIDTKAERVKMGEAIGKGVLKTLGITPVKAKSTYTGTLPKLTGKGYIAYGDYGINVERLQKFLNWYGKYDLDVDGKFGAKTLNALKKYQSAEGLSVDGKFGVKSLAKAKAVKR